MKAKVLDDSPQRSIALIPYAGRWRIAPRSMFKACEARAPRRRDSRRRIGLRWTIGAVAERGFEALRLSLWGAWRSFGPAARYVVCVNTIGAAAARARTGPVPQAVEWLEIGSDMPGFLSTSLAQDMAEGMAWKLVPLRVFPELHEISLDNDVVLWSIPPSLRDWLATTGPGSTRCLMAQDVTPCYGQFASQAPRDAFNAGVRGLPPRYDLARALRTALERRQRKTGSRPRLGPDDEQGLQVSALALQEPLRRVTLEEVTVCSPFHPHRPELGRCGAHFVGVNAHHIDWDYYDRPADEWIAEHWHRHRPELYHRTGLSCA